MGRDTRNDGWRNRAEFFALTHFGPLWRTAQAIRPIERWLNGKLINLAVRKTRGRPHPLSLYSDYPCWESLTNRNYTGRHLPPADSAFLSGLPPIENVVKLFERPSGQFRESATSSLLFSHFAQWFTDGFLRTSRANRSMNTSNHDIDLCSLYGRTRGVGDVLRHGYPCDHLNETAQPPLDVTTVQAWERQRRDRLGARLAHQFIEKSEFPAYFAGRTVPSDVAKELFLQEEAVPPFNEPARAQFRFLAGIERANNQIGYVMFNVLFLREHNRLCGILEKAHPGWEPERVYQTARNTVIAMLLRIVVEEYINHISPLHFQFRADPVPSYVARWYRPNWMTVEFNLLYRWHSLVPDSIAVGRQRVALIDTLFNNKLLIDRGIAGAFADASGQAAGEIGLYNTPSPLLEVEKRSVLLGRYARLRSYNDYREYVGFPRVTDFDQISGSEQIQKALRDVYKHVEQIEFAVGIFAEEPRPGSPLPPLIGRLVAIDAFSQALTNPLLSEHVFIPDTFAEGWDELGSTKCLSDVVSRNTPENGRRPVLVSMKRHLDPN